MMRVPLKTRLRHAPLSPSSVAVVAVVVAVVVVVVVVAVVLSVVLSAVAVHA